MDDMDSETKAHLGLLMQDFRAVHWAVGTLLSSSTIFLLRAYGIADKRWVTREQHESAQRLSDARARIGHALGDLNQQAARGDIPMTESLSLMIASLKDLVEGLEAAQVSIAPGIGPHRG